MKYTHLRPIGFLFLFSILLNSRLTYGQSGVSDNSFGKHGAVLTSIVSGHNDIAQSVSIAPNKKIVVVGNTYDVLGYSHIGVVRYLADGTLDKTFNNSGIATIQYGLANVVIAQPDNKILIGGALDAGLTNGLGLWRLNSDGTTDSSFGKNGSKSIALFNFGSAIGYAMTLQPDGKILIGGLAGPVLVMAKLTSNGTIDSSFANNGIFSFTISKENLICREILLQKDNKIIIAGQSDTLSARSSVNHHMLALRLQPNGRFDASFGNGGYVRYRKSPQGDFCYSAGLLPDSRIVLAGTSYLRSGSPASVLCLKSNGKIDNSFGNKGWQYIDDKTVSGSTANAMIIEPNGKIILAGTSYLNNGKQAVFLSKLTSNGSFDSSFASNGKGLFFTSGVVACNDARLQADGKIVTTGYQLLGTDEYLTARFLNNETLPAAKISNIAEPMLSVTNSLYVAIYPNPVVNSVLKLQIETNHKSQAFIEVYDANGARVTAPIAKQIVAGSNSETIQLPVQLAAGIYVCVVSNDVKKRTLRFMIAK